ncbi:G2/mitotic-specific cyclin-B-like isoform X2 [Pomacea canaliculata]|nr:G2/mitotic-specific cyclin-B-like isoform X2 [Pomacea canaliculata]
MMHEDDTEGFIASKAALASSMHHLAGSRFALGDIGNIGAKVSKMTIDDPLKKTSSSNAIKKEILHQQPPVTRQKARKAAAIAAAAHTNAVSTTGSSVINLSTISTKVKASSLKSEIHSDFKEKEPAVIVEAVPSVTSYGLSAYPAAPMDISEDKADAFSGGLMSVEDIDANDFDNPQLVSEYVNDIYDYMRSLERKFAVRPNYLEGAEITGKMRGILIDWLCQVHHRFHLLQETLYLTVAVIDRYLQEKPVTRNRLQLVGVTAMLLSSKYEEMFAPEVADFVYITDNAYTKADIREMERDILRTLKFSFGKPLCLHFLRRNSKAGQVDALKHTLAKYLMELTITEYDMVHYLPSHIAASALYLAMKILDGSPWTDTLAFYSTYTEEQLQPLAAKLASLVVKSFSGKLTAIRTKYSTSKLMKISQIPELKSSIVTDLAARASQ